MANSTVDVPNASANGGNKAANVEIQTLSFDDLVESLGAGLQDFRAAPLYGLFFGACYVLGGWLIIAMLWKLNLPFFAYPLAMGFVLVAPFFASGLYEVSRRLEVGEPLSWPAILGAFRGPEKRDLRWMALVTGFSMVLWMDIAAILFFGFMGFQDFGPDFFTNLFTTPSGLLFLLIGNTAGALIAAAVFSISVISFPMLFDRDIDFVTAMVTSVKTVEKNPRVMFIWALIIGALMLLSLLSALVGLIIIVPVLGHATWHLYRRTIVSAPADHT
jgi:uncharacterized membrane protein